MSESNPTGTLAAPLSKIKCDYFLGIRHEPENLPIEKSVLFRFRWDHSTPFLWRLRDLQLVATLSAGWNDRTGFKGFLERHSVGKRRHMIQLSAVKNLK